jgi:hypothetical protein
LQRCRTNFFVVHGWLEIEQGLDVSTHMLLSLAVDLIEHVRAIYLSVVAPSKVGHCLSGAYGTNPEIQQ